MSIDIIISNILKDMGISPANAGYMYLREAIKLTMDDPALVRKTTTKMYPMIADQYDVASTHVERNIRHAIEVAWDTFSNKKRDEIFRNTIKYSRGKPTNVEFIATVADYILLTEEVNNGT